ncbi:MAG: integration host factor subunit beta [Desulfobacterales bacterium]|nr:integration host factor subunit beta [Desulfobacterales bacterium]
MTKVDLIHALREETGLTRRKAQAVVDTFFGKITEALVMGERVEIRDFCNICVKEYRAYTGRHPKTGEHIHVKPKKLPFLKCGKELKEMVDYKRTKTEQGGKHQ